MADWPEKLLLAFIPLFVAIDPIGVVPLFLGISQGIEAERRRRIVNQATSTAAIVAISFMFLGRWIFRAVGITVADFQVGGVLILLGLAARDLLGVGPGISQTSEDFGVVPLGLPIIVGPATLTTLLIVMDNVGAGYALFGLLANLVLINVSFRKSDRMAKVIGTAGLRAFSKITSLLLAAIAVSMIRRGWHAL